MTGICEQINAQLEGVFSCTEHREGIRVRTPFQFPDGDIVDVYVLERSDTFTISDFGTAIQWLHTVAGDVNFTDNRKALLDDVLMGLRVDFYRGMLLIRGVNPDELAAAILRLCTAIIRTADIQYTFRPKPERQSFQDEVADIISLEPVGYERNYPMVGRSGRDYRVDFKLETHAPLFVDVLRTKSSDYASQKVSIITSKWFDLKDRLPGANDAVALTMFDDRLDVWSDSDLNLARQVTEVHLWSEADRFRERIQAAG